jgi:cyclophilin family peptidyl-prolyl cis-trans isomerase/Ca2+-binding RTX toxin-like protein
MSAFTEFPSSFSALLSRASSAQASDDYAASVLTAGVAPVRDRILGRIETLGDADWFAVELEPGVSYRFIADTLLAPLGTTALGNPRLRLLDSNGQAVAADDDSYVGTDALIQFTPQTSGRWFLEVSVSAATSAGTPATGSYALIVQADSGRNKPAALVSYTLSDTRLEVIFDTPIHSISWNGNLSIQRGHGSTLEPIALAGAPEVSDRSLVFNLSERIAGNQYLLLKATALPAPRVTTAFETFDLFEDMSSSIILGGDGDTVIDVSALSGDFDILDLGGNNRFVTGLRSRVAITSGAGNDQYTITRADTPIQDLGGTDSATVLSPATKLPSGIENVTRAPDASALPYWISALVSDGGAGHRFRLMLGDEKTYFYAFPQESPDYLDARYTEGFQGFSASQIASAESALALIASSSGLRFIRVASPAADDLMSFAINNQTGSAGYAVQPLGEWLGSDVFLNGASSSTASLADGGRGAYVLIHEIGHALGLKHPFSAPDASGEVAEAPYLSAPEDRASWTMMSYTATAADYQLRLGPLDIAALQYLYGPNPAVRSGDDRYTVSLIAPNFIWDGGGSDLIDLSSLPLGADVSLEPGYWGFVGSVRASTITEAAQVTINFDTEIEALLGSAFNDRLAGNALPNLIRGGMGLDTIEGAAGNDTLEGGDRRDRLAGSEGDDLLDGGAGSDFLDGGPGVDTARLAGPVQGWRLYAAPDRFDLAAVSASWQELDQMHSVEQLRFSDASLAVSSVESQGLLMSEAADFSAAGPGTAAVPPGSTKALWTGSLTAGDTDGLQITVPAGHRLTRLQFVDLRADSSTVTIPWSIRSMTADGPLMLSNGVTAQHQLGTPLLNQAPLPGAYLLQVGGSDATVADYGLELELTRVNTRPSGALGIMGMLRAGELLSASNQLTDPDGIPGAGTPGQVSYQWRSDGYAIAGATGPTFRLTTLDVGSRITVTARYTDLGGTEETVTSAASAAVAAAAAEPAAYTPLPRMRLQTTYGDLIVELEADRAPITVQNFRRYAETDYYDNTEFHRIIATFMAQGGGYDRLSNGTYEQRLPRFSAIPLEPTNLTGLSNLVGTLAMARTEVPNSATSEFFINFVDNLFLDAANANDGNGYAVFGRVVGGADVLAQFRAVPVVNTGTSASPPTIAVSLIDVRSETPASGAPPTGNVTVTGAARQGQTLGAQALLSDIDGIPSSGSGAVRYFWTLDDGTGPKFIYGATTSSLTLNQSQVGKAVRAHAQYTDNTGTTGVVASAPINIANTNDQPSGRVWITGSTQADSTLTASHDVRDSDGIPSIGAPGSPGWQWLVDGVPVAGATASTFQVSSIHAGKSIAAVLRYTDLAGTAEAVTSAPAGATTVSAAPALPRVFMRTNYGDLLVELESQKAPISATNFLEYVDGGFYDGSVIHRILPGSVIQGGGFSLERSQTTGEYYYAPKSPGAAISLERTTITGLSNTLGTIAMARATDPNTASSQFFFNLRNNSSAYDSASGRDGYAVFGTVLDGLPALAGINQVQIGNVPVPNVGTLTNAPLSPVVVQFAVSDRRPPSGDVLITGTAEQGQTLVASHTLNDSDGAVSLIGYQWRVNGVRVVGASSDSLLLSQAFVGKAISASAIYQDGANAGYVLSRPTSAIADINDMPSGAVRIDGRPVAGATLTASHTLADLDNGVSSPSVTQVTWQWFAGADAIAGATSSTLAVKQAFAGKVISVRASYTDAANWQHDVSSQPTEPVRPAVFTGSVYHWKQHVLLDGVQIEARADGSADTSMSQGPHASSAIDGRFTLDSLNLDGVIQLAATRETATEEAARAVSAADVLAALKLAVGRSPNATGIDSPSTPLPVSPFQWLAGDINRDGAITRDDAEAILRVASGATDAAVPGWRFVGESEAIARAESGSLYSRNAVPGVDPKALARAGDSAPINFVGVLTGDVDGSWTPGSAQAAPEGSYDVMPTDYFRSLGLTSDALAQWGIAPV